MCLSANWKPYAVSVFSAAVCPARDKVPCRTDFSLRRAPRLFFAHTVKRCACGFFFVLFLSAKKKNILSPFPKGGTVFFSPEREKNGKIYRGSRLGLPAAGWEPYPHGSRHDGLTRFARSPRPKPKNHLYPFEARPYYQLYPDTMLRIAGQTRRAGCLLRLEAPTPPARGDFAVFAHESGAFDKKSPLPKTRKALSLSFCSQMK